MSRDVQLLTFARRLFAAHALMPGSIPKVRVRSPSCATKGEEDSNEKKSLFFSPRRAVKPGAGAARTEDEGDGTVNRG